MEPKEKRFRKDSNASVLPFIFWLDVLDDFSLLLFTLKSQGRSQGRHIIEMEHISMVNDKLKAFKYYVYRRTDEFLELFHLPYLLSLAQLL